MKYYFKQSFFLIVYNLFMSITAFGIMAIPEHLLWLQMILFALNMGLYILILCMVSFKEGQTALKVRSANDLEREQIVKTGNALPLKLHEEYKPWKGYFIGFLIASPIIICLIIHSILIAFNTNFVGAGAVAGIIYMAFCGPIITLFGEGGVWYGAVPLFAQYYILLYAVVVISVANGIAYNKGAAKMQRSYDKIKAKQREIYGE